MTKRIHITVRRVLRTDPPFFRDAGQVSFIAEDQDGRRFGADTEREAREMAERYNNPPQLIRRRQPRGAR